MKVCWEERIVLVKLAVLCAWIFLNNHESVVAIMETFASAVAFLGYTVEIATL